MTITLTNPTIPPPPPVRTGQSAGRVVALVLGFCLLAGSAGALATAGLLSWAGDDRRDGDYLTTDETSLSSDSHALTVEKVDLNGFDADWLLGDARLRATSQDSDTSIFIGVARTDDVADFLHDVTYTTVVDLDHSGPTYVDHAGNGAPTTPEATDIWVAQASGTGTQSLTWTPRDGSWTAIIMNTDGSAGVDVRADVGATVPVLSGPSGARGSSARASLPRVVCSSPAPSSGGSAPEQRIRRGGRAHRGAAGAAAREAAADRGVVEPLGG